MIKAKCIALAAFIVFGQFGIALPSIAQGVFDTPEFQCLDRCSTEFKTCLGTPVVDPTEPLTPLCPDGPCNSGTDIEPTPPPFDQCLAAKQLCEATCTIERLNKQTSE